MIEGSGSIPLTSGSGSGRPKTCGSSGSGSGFGSGTLKFCSILRISVRRNELSGALTGLTRVRRFQQDDAHIFCRPDQIKAEMAGCLDFLKHVYGIFGFTYQLR
jgi:hypothetical protein